MSASASVAITVPVAPERAFDIFTRDIGLWWRRTPQYRFRPGRDGTLRFEPGIGGRLVEAYGEAPDDLYEVGRVLDWIPGERLAFEWRGPNYLPGQATEVEVRFRATAGGTRVVVEHRGWETLPPNHPALHGDELGAHLRRLGTWWQGALDGLLGRFPLA
jgi:uncharacterized protein YndB with AHSA1/START domain